MLLGCRDAAIALAVFDVLSLEGTSTMREPYWRRREIVDSFKLAGPCWSTVPAFDDGAALWQVVCAQQMEGVVAKPRTGTYRPGERGWLKVKNRAYWKYELEREAAIEGRLTGHRKTRARPEPLAVVTSPARCFLQIAGDGLSPLLRPAEGELEQRRNPAETGGRSRGSALTAQAQRTGDAADGPRP
jgi:hypothetical protein